MHCILDWQEVLLTAEQFTQNEHALERKVKEKERKKKKFSGRKEGRKRKKDFGCMDKTMYFPNFISKHVAMNQQQNST